MRRPSNAPRSRSWPLADAEGSLSLTLPPTVTMAAAPTPKPAAAAEDQAPMARATIAGRFLQAHPWRTKPFAEIGRRVTAGEIVGLVQVGRLNVP